MDTAGDHKYEEGAQALIASGEIQINRLPLLTDILSACFEDFSEVLAREYGIECHVELERFEAKEGAEIQTSEAFFALAKVAPWGKDFSMGIHVKTLDFLIQKVFGGDVKGAGAFEEGRPFSELDLTVAKDCLSLAFRSFEAAWQSLLSVSFEEEHAFFGPDTLEDQAIKGGGVNWLVAETNLSIEEHKGRFFWLIPQAILGQIKHLLDRPTPPAPPAFDEAWAKKMRDGVGKADVTLEVFLGSQTITLGDVSLFKIGDVIPLLSPAPRRVALRCEGRVLFLGELGQTGGHYVVRISDFFSSEEDGKDGVIAH